jgi:hypothetical protein
MLDGVSAWWNPTCGIEMGLRTREEQESCSSTETRLRGGVVIIGLLAGSVALAQMRRDKRLTAEEWKERMTLLFGMGGVAALWVLFSKTRANSRWNSIQANLLAAERAPERAKLLHAQQLAESAVRSADASERQARLEELRQAGAVAREVTRAMTDPYAA